MQQRWIWQNDNWTRFYWNDKAIQPLLRDCHKAIGLLQGKQSLEGESPTTVLDTLLQNLLASSAIEGEELNASSVRSSLAQHLGISDDQPYPVSDRSEGLTEMLMDALNHLETPMTQERLCHWQRLLFPESALPLTHAIRVGELRGHEPMQVVSGRLDRQKVHFEAPPRDKLETLLQEFCDWFNQDLNTLSIDPLVRAGVAHLWFVTLHPFDDGNGRLTRALTDRALAQADAHTVRLFAMSVTILDKRSEYYSALEAAQWHQDDNQGSDITEWCQWFLTTLLESVNDAINQVDRTIAKAQFWQTFRDTPLSVEQKKVLNRLLDGGPNGFEQGINAAQYQKVAKVSKATATRHLADLVVKGCVGKLPGGGRSTRYRLNIVR
jgi:Fic family protein